jgi:hypothetical protein
LQDPPNFTQWDFWFESMPSGNPGQETNRIIFEIVPQIQIECCLQQIGIFGLKICHLATLN